MMPVVRRCNLKKVISMIALLILSAVLVLSVSFMFKNNSSNTDTPSTSTSQNSNVSSKANEYPPFDESVDLTLSSEPSQIAPSIEASNDGGSAQSSDYSSEDSSATASAESSSQSQSFEETSSEEPSSKQESSEDTSSEDSSQISSEDISSDIPVISPIDSEMRAIWISYIDMANIIKGKTESQFKANFEKVCKNSAEYGLNTIVVHVRPFSDAYYDSDIFPWSSTITGTQGQNPGFDPLKIMVELAHKYNLKIEAWINPYRVATSGVTMSKDNPAYKWLDTDKVKKVNGNYFYNPADEEVMQLIVDGVEEIVENYDVDGIHFDDYFYPTTDKSFDDSYYKSYKNSGGTMSLENYRRNNVTTLLRKVYSAVKAIDSNVTFGISPNGNNNTNFNSLFLDIQSVVSAGCVDYICPQIYFGFNHGSLPYKSTVEQWSGYVKNSPVKIYIGLAAYKIGVSDQWAGTGKNEWTQSDDILKRQVEYLRSTGKCDGFMLYCYSSLFAPESSISSHAEKEKNNLGSILK